MGHGTALRDESGWTVKQLLGEIAAILIRLENGKEDDARYMAEQIIGDTDYHAKAFEEYAEEHKEELDL